MKRALARSACGFALLVAVVLTGCEVPLTPGDEQGTPEPVAEPVEVTTTSLAAGVEYQPYEQTLTAVGGSGTFTWSLAAGSDPLPDGLSLDVDGTISGEPTADGTTFFTVEATSNGESAVRELSILVSPGCYLADCAGLQGLWEFDEASLTDGSTVSDASPAGRTATLVSDNSGVNKSIVGQRGNAVGLDGTFDYLTVPDDPGLDLGSDFTLLVWINPAALPSNTYQALISKSASPTRPASLWLWEDQVEVYFSPVPPRRAWSSAGVLTVGAWQHVAATFDDTADEIRIYVDGVLETTVSGVADSPEVNDQSFVIGQRGDNILFFNGGMDDVMVWSRALSDQEVADIYDRTRD